MIQLWVEIREIIMIIMSLLFLSIVLPGETIAFNECKSQNFEGTVIVAVSECSDYKIYNVKQQSSYYANKIKNSGE